MVYAIITSNRDVFLEHSREFKDVQVNRQARNACRIIEVYFESGVVAGRCQKI